MNPLVVILGVLVAFIIGGGIFVYWLFTSETRDRYKHYRVAITIKQDGTLGVYKSKWVELGKDPIVVVSSKDTPLVELDIKLSNGKVTVIDSRFERG